MAESEGPYPLVTLQVIQMVSYCGDNSDVNVQLTVIKALLTATTAEHFRVHGDCLVQVKHFSITNHS